ncbi:MAG: division/cell wall cluster transcriptional repressor MraZ [Chloroflexi bacterium]|nr:MAG: division/cell wall cluster transcriptional repressor MraZ [Chloroflexota bacterium]TMG71917.1 MAG: division/cell wall cluster transcriptional repressor MraZ [Chloroflexota bacterium]
MGNRRPEAEGKLEGYFAGEFAHSLDEKGRLAIPAKFRGRFKEGAVVTRWIGECLAVFPAAEWATLNAEIAKRPRTDPAVSRFRHFVLAGAHETDPDAQGRVTIPAHLRRFAALGADAVVIGNADHLEVWEPARWRGELARVQTDIERDLRDLGI